MKTAFSHLKWFFKKEWKRYLFCAILLLIVSITPVFPAKFLGLAIDEIVGGTLTKTSLLWYLGGIFLFPLANYFFNYGYHYTINSLGHELSFQLRENYLNHLFELDAKIYEQYTKGDLVARASNDLQTLTILATTFLQSVIYHSVLIISSITMMILIHPLLTLASTIFMPIAIFWLNKKRLKKREYYKTHHEIYADMTESVLESVEGVKTIRAYGLEDSDFKKTKESIDKDINSWWKILKFESLYTPMFELVYAFAYFIAIGFGSYLVVTTKITPGNLITFLVYIAMLYAPLINLSNILNSVNNITIADARYHEIMHLIPEVKDEDTPVDVMSFSKINFNNVSFRYPFDNFDVIKNINLEINLGETIGIVGPTGAGKSTLIRQLLRQFNVTSGQILIDGKDIKQYKIEDIHNLVGYVPQDHILFRRTVDDNILIGNPKATTDQITQAMTVADFIKDLKSLAEGGSTMVSELGGSLSGGQRQRLSIARALVKNPEILILDDSLSAVDALTESNILAQLKESRKGKTNIIIAHRFSAISSSDKIIVLQDGKITDIGTHEELLQYDNWYKMQYLRSIKGEIYEEL